MRARVDTERYKEIVRLTSEEGMTVAFFYSITQFLLCLISTDGSRDIDYAVLITRDCIIFQIPTSSTKRKVENRFQPRVFIYTIGLL